QTEPLSKNVSAPKRRQPERRFRRCSPTHETRRDKGLRPHGIPIAIARPQRIRCCPETPVEVKSRASGSNSRTLRFAVGDYREGWRRRGQWGATSEEEWSEWFIRHTNHSRPPRQSNQAAMPILPVHVGRAACRCVSRRSGFLR